MGLHKQTEVLGVVKFLSLRTLKGLDDFHEYEQDEMKEFCFFFSRNDKQHQQDNKQGIILGANKSYESLNHGEATEAKNQAEACVYEDILFLNTKNALFIIFSCVTI